MTCASSAEIGDLKASVCFAESKELRGGLDHRRAGARIAEFASPERKCSPPTLASGSQLLGNHEEAADESDSRRANEAENSTRGTPVKPPVKRDSIVARTFRCGGITPPPRGSRPARPIPPAPS